ncbi:MAG: TonB-dependent receptor [Bacteroidales bacterium]|nr:TonB-dependent receptor [Bacteroidales bacterium]MDY0333955.1 TonB-dependent receptor [Bacteroidales bacterium]NLO51965.1 TonB-dependent receptor [Bacteroidales bacterium]
MNLKGIKLYCLFVLLPVLLHAQTGTISGLILDSKSGEPLIGANIIYAPGKGTVTDIDGRYVLNLPYGNYTLKASYVGFESVEQQINLQEPKVTIDFMLDYLTLTEVEVVGDIARARETPVAFSTIQPKTLQEELASQDIPLMLNATPGVFATQQGGGDGDSRINIRGFNQRNVAVMLDGVPVNDMENGWVYWSNWFGLDVVMHSTQVQRGLGASKLAIPSVGGTINLQTKGIGARRNVTLKQEVGDNGFLRTSLGYTSGKLKGGWGITAAGSYKRGNGWVDMTWTEGWFYFVRIDKDLGNHRLSLKAMGAPQRHSQRSYKKSIAEFDTAYAHDLGITNDQFLNKPLNLGIKYNPNWGYLERYSINESGDTLHADRNQVSGSLNYYHKPMFSISDFWNVNKKLYISNIAYLSLGNGGGTGLENSASITADGQMDLQSLYNANRYGKYNADRVSQGILRSAINNHVWYGLLSTFNYQINDILTLSGGIDLRSYTGKHYREIYDLLGGDYYISRPNQLNANEDPKLHKVLGDKYGYYNDGIVRWGGLFGQLEYKKDKFSAFINITASYSGYKRIDYFKPKVLELSDTTLRIGYSDVINYNGVIYDRNSPGLEFAETGWKYIPGATIKGGANYNINDNMNVFANMGYLSKAPRFNNVYDNNNTLFRDIENELVKAVEVGYSYYNSKITFNLNGYYTIWDNKPADRAASIRIDDETYSVNINGMDALHKGVELELAYKVTKQLMYEGLLSLGDWKWTSADSARIYDDYGNLKQVRYFDAKGIYVGDAAQFQTRHTLRYEMIPDLYLKAAFTWFDKYYSQFDPLNLDPVTYPGSFDDEGNPRQSWKVPGYYQVDMHAGYGFYLSGVRLDIRGSVLNLLDEKYISDADNNDSFGGQSFNDFDAKSAAVFFGLGRRYNISLQLSF